MPRPLGVRASPHSVEPTRPSAGAVMNGGSTRVTPAAGPTQREAIVRQVAGYAGTDLVCYRAARPPTLVARQHAVWQPLIDWAKASYAAPLVVTDGVIPASQPAASLEAFAAAVAEYDEFA